MEKTLGNLIALLCIVAGTAAVSHFSTSVYYSGKISVAKAEARHEVYQKIQLDRMMRGRKVYASLEIK